MRNARHRWSNASRDDSSEPMNAKGGYSSTTRCFRRRSTPSRGSPPASPLEESRARSATCCLDGCERSSRFEVRCWPVPIGLNLCTPWRLCAANCACWPGARWCWACARRLATIRMELRIASGLSTGKGFSARPMLEHFGTTVPEARVALRRWMRHRPSEQEWRAWELTRGLELATGSVGPRQTMARAVDGPAAMLIAAGGTYGIDGALALLAIWSSAKVHPASPLDLHLGSSAMAARGRALVASLAVNHRLCSAASVARYFHRAKATLSEQMSACRARPSDRIILGTPLRRILV
jgi:hypothetical protein